jgi:hypothetical protein
MKNQYFADVNDYTKYFILRQFLDVPKIIYWMLTKDDKPNFPRKLEYLKSKGCADLDKELWDHLSKCVTEKKRDVSYIEKLLGNVVHYEKRPIDEWVKREAISNEVISMAREGNIVFLDPDNGYQVSTCPEGTSRSSKHVYDFEIRGLLEKGVTTILYQHLKMGQSVDNMVQHFSKRWKGQYRFAVRTSFVVYYFLSNADLNWAMDRLAIKENDKPHTRLRLLRLKSESMIEFARMVLSPNGMDDLDCAGWGLQEILTLDPENAEAAALLKEIIARIDQRFDAGDRRGTECHRILRRESPSPYVRAIEGTEVNSKYLNFARI